MFKWTFIALALPLVTVTVSVPTAVEQDTLSIEKRSIPNTQGTNNGYFYSVYSDSSVSGSYSNGASGEYSLNWTGSGDVVAGKGWNPGGPR